MPAHAVAHRGDDDAREDTGPPSRTIVHRAADQRLQETVAGDATRKRKRKRRMDEGRSGEGG